MTDHYVRMQYADDGQPVFSNWDDQSIGDTGEYGLRITWTRLGQYRQRVYRFRCSSPRKRDMLALVGEAYTYTYTITAGDSAIVKTTIDATVLPDGMAWDQGTATLSGTPTEAAVFEISPRVVDANGLWASLEDEIEIEEAEEP